jgi:hypothetical protein
VTGDELAAVEEQIHHSIILAVATHAIRNADAGLKAKIWAALEDAYRHYLVTGSRPKITGLPDLNRRKRRSYSRLLLALDYREALANAKPSGACSRDRCAQRISGQGFSEPNFQEPTWILRYAALRPARHYISLRIATIWA